MTDSTTKKLTVFIDEETWKACKRRMVDDGHSFQSLLSEMVSKYATGNDEVNLNEINAQGTIAAAESRSTMSVTKEEQEAVDALLSILRSGDAGATQAILSNVHMFVRVVANAPDPENSQRKTATTESSSISNTGGTTKSPTGRAIPSGSSGSARKRGHREAG